MTSFLFRCQKPGKAEYLSQSSQPQSLVLKNPIPGKHICSIFVSVPSIYSFLNWRGDKYSKSLFFLLIKVSSPYCFEGNISKHTSCQPWSCWWLKKFNCIALYALLPITRIRTVLSIDNCIDLVFFFRKENILMKCPDWVLLTFPLLSPLHKKHKGPSELKNGLISKTTMHTINWCLGKNRFLCVSFPVKNKERFSFAI